jgi:hypothetical protein
MDHEVSCQGYVDEVVNPNLVSNAEYNIEFTVMNGISFSYLQVGGMGLD